ncbi:hypothetical protein O6H91_23G011000 [Diphasiastrum complanatum]|uniref:Uncharacterized protein n=1 Tax=Diphasiastrum complanatum TaxID=34168 RepID=A0ACC2A823_DIPCM|nr:hypothetical protein O6H91_23G011000 [Diphasiastrum complanatum]
MAEFAEMEAVNGVHIPWNVWPSSCVETSKCMVPLAAVMTHLQALDPSLSPLPYSPLCCKTCRYVSARGRIRISEDHIHNVMCDHAHNIGPQIENVREERERQFKLVGLSLSGAKSTSWMS